MAPPEHEAVDFRMADSHGYILSRGQHLATARLNLQHYLWQQILGFTIHPRIREQLPADPMIADIAAGTALWTIEAARAVPAAQLHAYDVDLTSAPPRAWRPQNVQLAEWDIFTDPPAEMVGRYDLVHLRLLVLVLSGVDPVPVIRRLRSLLKPGGWLQWEDIHSVRAHVKRASPDAATPAMDAIIAMSDSGGRHDWTGRLADLLAAQGFVESSAQEFDDPIELARAINDVNLMTMEEFAAGLAKAGKTAPSERVLDMVRGADSEAQQGAALCYPRVCCIAKNA